MADDRLDQLWAEREIRRQLNTYCRGLDRFDVELWRSVWHADATLDYRGSNLRGPAMEMAEMMTVGHELWASHSHQITSFQIVVRGERAVSETYNTAILREHPDAEGLVLDSHYRSRYLDRWSCRGGCWAIDDRFVPSGVVSRQTVSQHRLGTLSRRSREDPSYAHFESFGCGSDDRLGVLTAECEIRRRLATVCRALDRRDPQLWLSAWHPDATVAAPDARLEGTVVEVGEQLFGGLEAWAGNVHQITNSLIVVDGDRAVSETGGNVLLHGRSDAFGRCVDDHERVRYLDRWSRRDGRWAIDHRLVVSEFSWRQFNDRARAGSA